MDLLISVGFLTALCGFAYLAMPLVKLWLSIERHRDAPRAITISVLGNDGNRVIVTLRTDCSGRFNEREIDKFIRVFAEADRARPIAAAKA